MSFLTMDDEVYIEEIPDVYELNNFALLRQAFIDSYKASAANYTTFRAELDSLEKQALEYRKFVREAVRRCLHAWKKFSRHRVMDSVAEADIPEEDREQVVDYVEKKFRSLQEGNIVHYRIDPAELARIVGN